MTLSHHDKSTGEFYEIIFNLALTNIAIVKYKTDLLVPGTLVDLNGLPDQLQADILAKINDYIDNQPRREE